MNVTNTNAEKQIFLSYSWNNEKEADIIDNDFKAIGVTFIRDKRDAPYRTNLKTFMHRIQQSDFVLMIISDSYLKSENCMYEMVEVLNTHEFPERILPIILDDAKAIFRIQNRAKYYDFWKAKVDEAKDLNSLYGNIDSVQYFKKCTSIYSNLDVFFDEITSLNVHDFTDLKQKNYSSILTIIEVDDQNLLKQLLELDPLPDTQAKEIQVDKFLQDNSNNSNGYYVKALLHYHRKQYEIAIYNFERSIQYNNSTKSNISLAYDMIGSCLFEQEKYTEALPVFIEANSIHNKHLGIAHNVALTYYKLGNYTEAAKYYNEAICNEPGNDDNYSLLGDIQAFQQFLFEEAKLNYERALELNPSNTHAHLGLGYIFTQHLINLPKSEKHLLDAFALKPRNKYINFHLAEYYVEVKRFCRAKMFYLRAIKLDPLFENAYNNLGYKVNLYYSEYEEALANFIKSIELNPDFENAIINKANILIDKFNDYDQAEILLKSFVHKDPKNEIIEGKINSDELLDEINLTTSSLENLKRKDIFSARACGSLGVLYMMKGNETYLAFHYFKLSLFLNPNDAKCLFNISNFVLQAFNNQRLFALFYIRSTSLDVNLANPQVDRILSIDR